VVDPDTGAVATLAGGDRDQVLFPGDHGVGDDGAASATAAEICPTTTVADARFFRPRSVACDIAGRIVVSEQLPESKLRLRVIDRSE
jgi:hypothetical protein